MTRVLLALLVVSTGLLLALLAAAVGLPGGRAAAPQGSYSLSGKAAPPATHASTEPLPICTVTDLPAPRSDYQQWDQTVLDSVFALEPSYVPPDLVAAAAAFPAAQSGGGDFKVRSVMIDDLRAMLTAAATAGLELAIQSAYRSYDYQSDTFEYWVEREGLAAALATSARPGHSEHQLGTALDLRSRNGPPAWELSDWAQTPAGGWVAANAWRFGFVMSYPAGSKELTCYDYEPWHYRYLGRELAAEVERQGVTPRELLWAKIGASRSE